MYNSTPQLKYKQKIPYIETGGVAASCAPGASMSKYAYMIPGGAHEKWCELCKGDGSGVNKCARNSNEKYYGYHGAFQSVFLMIL